MIQRILRSCLLVVVLAAPGAAWADDSSANDSSTNKGGPARFSTADIQSIRNQMHGLVDQKQAAGIVTLIVQNGKTIDFDAYGVADAETKEPMRKDAVMAIASMTKPITGVALMILHEQGKWALDDPIAKHIPEFKDLQVMSGNGKTVAPNHPPTMRELVSHNAGFTYGFFGTSEVDKLYVQAGVLDANSNLKTMIGKLAKIPLKHQPGTVWEYSASVDIQGYIIEKLSGMPYDAFVRERVLKPLKMKDTDFAVFGEARKRLAYTHVATKTGELKIALPPGGRTEVAKKVPGLPSPGGALYSTAQDYARFCQMLLNGGTLDGARILKPESVRLMHTNLLPKDVFVTIAGTSNGTGFGVDFAISPGQSAPNEPLPAASYYWSGIFGTYFWIDPTNNLYVVGMIQRAFLPAEDPSYDPVFVRNAAAKAIYTALAD
jgi:CubicO group peptidase (beta-lactamase class C family)